LNSRPGIINNLPPHCTGVVADLARQLPISGRSSEGVFARLQGLRRLTEIGEHRVDLPEIVLEM
jgi:hypothetical protein